MRYGDSKPSVDEKYIRPLQAAELMKTARNMNRPLYIYGSAGHGKTCLVADFLARRRYQYYSIADHSEDELAGEMEAMQEEEDIACWGKQPIVVIDDLHLLDTEDSRERWYAILQALIKRKGLWLIMISRSPVPRWLKSLYVKYLFIVIEEETLRLTEKERPEYFRIWEFRISQEYADRIWNMARGYPLFLRFLALQVKRLETDLATDADRDAETTALEVARRDAWDYLEAHVYDQWNIELQEFLMDVAVVEQFDLQMAQFITKNNAAGHWISMAQEVGNFIEEKEMGGTTVFQLRKEMRESLLRRLFRKRSRSHIDMIFYNAGSVYELRGDVPTALRMYEKCQNEEGISRLLIQNVRKNPGAGYYYELKDYYLALSEETIKDSAELMCGMSLLHSILMNIEESERWYRELERYMKRQTGSGRRMARVRLLYLDIALPHRGIIQMTNLLKRASVLLTEERTQLPDFSITNNQPSMMNGGKDFCEWSRHDRELANSIGKLVELVLGRSGKGLVSLALAESFFEKGADSYEVSNLANRGRVQAESGGRYEQVFVAIGILSQLSILNNHMEDAFELLEGFQIEAEKDAPQILSNLDTLKIRFLLYAGRGRKVAQWMIRAPNEDEGFCTLDRFAYMAKARAYLAFGKKEKALNLLQRMIVYAEKMHRTYIFIESHILLAITLYRLREKSWQETLQTAITMAEKYHFVRILAREGAALWELLKAGDFVWQDTDYKDQVLAECEHIAELYPAYLSERQLGNVLLTDKALKILRLQAQGMTIEQIADQLGLSVSGVKYYNQETYKKLKVSGKAAAVNEARNRGLL